MLSRLNLTLGSGEIVLVLGRNGSGKSTLLRTVAGLLAPSAGRITFGEATDEVRGAETAHYLGYEDALKPTLTVHENLAFWAAMLPGVGEPKADDGSIGAALEAFGIARLLHLPAGYLSAGQKRRVSLARLLLATRPVWLLDEPLIALDVGAQGALTQIMGEHAGRGGAILVASHQPLALPHRELDLSAAMGAAA